MSGFAGIVHLDGAPADCDLLWRLTRSMAFRGPDAQEIQALGAVGFGHAMLRTTDESASERQPCSLNGEIWITADCRIDAREELIHELKVRGRHPAEGTTDPGLILYAYQVWETDCVQHLLGDFSFAIWDPSNQRLFCARDQLGVKQFYYSRKPHFLVFSNTLSALRLHPGVSPRLNDLAIADFLVFGHNQELSTTTFADIQKLPPAHTLTWSEGQFRIDKYWMLPVDPPLQLRRRADYLDTFRQLLQTATRDRLRTDRAGVLMSGGMDSTVIASVAKSLMDRMPGAELSAHTLVFDRLVPDRERYFAGIAAAHLGIPVHFHAADDYRFHSGLADHHTRSPEAQFMTDFGPESACAEMAGIAAEARVAFWGEGPDNALHYEWRPYIQHQLKHRNFVRLLFECGRFPFSFRQIPFSNRRGSKSRRPLTPAGSDSIPQWINPDFAARTGLHERYAALREGGTQQPSAHPTRPVGYDSFSAPLWQWLFEWHDPGVSGLPLEIRNPYLDLRVLRFLLTVPAIPWCRDKYLLRQAFRDSLPAEIIARPKTGLPGFPSFERWKEIGLAATSQVKAFSAYVDAALLENSAIDNHHSLGMRLRAMSLGFFLREL